MWKRIRVHAGKSAASAFNRFEIHCLVVVERVTRGNGGDAFARLQFEGDFGTRMRPDGFEGVLSPVEREDAASASRSFADGINVLLIDEYDLEVAVRYGRIVVDVP